MVPVTVDLTVYRGDTFSMFFRLRHRLEDGTSGDYIVLTGRTPKAQIRATSDTNTVMAEFVAVLGDQALYPGSVLLTLPSTVTAAMSAGGTWDCQLVTEGTNPPVVKTYISGAVTLIKDVTR